MAVPASQPISPAPAAATPLMPPLLVDLPPYLTLRRGALANAAAHLDLHRRVLVVTDAGVPPAYAQALAEAAAQS